MQIFWLTFFLVFPATSWPLDQIKINSCVVIAQPKFNVAGRLICWETMDCQEMIGNSVFLAREKKGCEILPAGGCPEADACITATNVSAQEEDQLSDLETPLRQPVIFDQGNQVQ